MKLPECDRCRSVTPALLGLSPAYMISEVGSTRYTYKDKPIYVRGATARMRNMAHMLRGETTIRNYYGFAPEQAKLFRQAVNVGADDGEMDIFCRLTLYIRVCDHFHTRLTVAHGYVCIWYVTRYAGKRIVQWVPPPLGVGAYHAGEP